MFVPPRRETEPLAPALTPSVSYFAIHCPPLIVAEPAPLSPTNANPPLVSSVPLFRMIAPVVPALLPTVRAGDPIVVDVNVSDLVALVKSMTSVGRPLLLPTVSVELVNQPPTPGSVLAVLLSTLTVYVPLLVRKAESVAPGGVPR